MKEFLFEEIRPYRVVCHNVMYAQEMYLCSSNVHHRLHDLNDMLCLCLVPDHTQVFDDGENPKDADDDLPISGVA